MILRMQNAVPSPQSEQSPVARRAAERALAQRYSVYVAETQRLIEAARTVMQRTESVEPRVSEIVGEAGLSNQAFYRHFRSKHELLLAVLADGQEQLVRYLEQRMAAEAIALDRVRRWIRCIVKQAAHPRAAEATRIFVVNAVRLADQFPGETSRSLAEIKAPLRAALEDAVAHGDAPGADPERDTDAIYHLAMGWMERKIIERVCPSQEDVDHVVRFAVRGLLGDNEPARGEQHGT